MAIETTQSPLQISTVEVGGQKIRVGIKKPEPGIRNAGPLLIFNGIGANLEMLEPFVNQLHGIEVITFDVPGVGGSPAKKLPYRFSNLAALVNKMLERLGYGAVDVLGVSWGGGAAQQFAYQYPKRCRKLVLAATCAGMFMMPGKPTLIRKMGSPRRYKDATYMAELGPLLYGGDFADDPSLMREHMSRGAKISPLGYYYQMFAAFGWTSVLWLHRIRQPTLILAGRRDPIIPLINARLLAWRIPDSTLHVINDGHLFMVSRPAESATLVLRFLSGETPLALPIGIAIIKDEHRAFTAVLNGLVYLVEEIQAGRLPPNFDLLRALLRYVEDFPDKLHHPKEDLYLVKFLKKRGAATTAEKIMGEHQEGRDRTRALVEALDRYEAGGSAELASFSEQLHGYAKFQGEHMRKEEEIALPMAEKLFTAADWQEIDVAFAANEDPIVGIETQDSFHKLFRRIIELAPPPFGVGSTGTDG